MEQAVAFREERTRDRLEALAETGFVAVEPLLELLEDMSQHREVLEEWHADTDVLDSFRAKVIAALEEGAKGVHHWKPASVVARLVKKTDETVRSWCRQEKVRHRKGPNGTYVVHVPSAIKYNASLTR